MKKDFVFLVLAIVLFSCTLRSQQLKPGFDKSECLSMLEISARFGDTAYARKFPEPVGYKMIYRSPVVGMDNLWELWMSDQGMAVISLRGTTLEAASWLEDFYSAMVPAKGELHLSDSFNFQYELATNPRAAVHIGWLIGTGFLARDIIPRIDSLYKNGVKDFYITGHSQGGAISFLMTSYLYSLQKNQTIPSDIRFKTYSTAAPKVGNLYYAYDYAVMTQFGWAYNIVNPADWVPEGMFSIQTTDDFNNTNPFTNAKELIGKLPFPKNLVLKYFYNRMDGPVRTAEYRFQECLGKGLEKYVKKAIPGFQPPSVYYNSMDYVRVGNVIVLPADSAYLKLFPDDPSTVFVHHLHDAYYYLATRLPDNNVSPAP